MLPKFLRPAGVCVLICFIEGISELGVSIVELDLCVDLKRLGAVSELENLGVFGIDFEI